MIFGIGLARTGTTSLSKALSILGYNSHHAECNILRLKNEVLFVSIDLLRQFDAVVGVPLAPYIGCLRAHFEGAKYVLTVRDVEQWLSSSEKMFSPALVMDEQHKELHRILYGSVLFDRVGFRVGYEKHVKETIRMFESSDDLLVMDIEDGDGWEPLCRFLEKDIPDVPFPHLSKRGSL